MKSYIQKKLCFQTKVSPNNKFLIIILIVFIGGLFTLLQSCKTEKNELLPIAQNKYVLGYVRATAEKYATIPKASAGLLSGALPGTYSLDVPAIAFNQGQIGSCGSVAAATDLSIQNHRQYGTPYINNGIIYSPSFLYDQAIAIPGDCSSGSTGPGNFDILISLGDCQLPDMPYDGINCSTQPTTAQKNLASSHKISQYLTINPISAVTIKQYIYSGIPVIVAHQVDANFENSTSTSIWSSFGTESLGWHCTVLYGWDDSKNAFRMLNSWGSTWGDNGSTWVDYNFVETGSSPQWGKIFGEAYVIENASAQSIAPIANFDVNGASTAINQNQSIAFYDRSLNNPTSWVWTFQGGSPDGSNVQNPTVTYANPGTYTVTLTASNTSGSNTKTASNYIVVSGGSQVPIAQFSATSNTNIATGASVSFISQSSNNPTSFLWSFPGGTPSSSTTANPTVVYTTPGIYPVSLTVSNQSGSNTLTMPNYISVSSSQAWTCGQPFTDPRDGHVYNTVNINGTCWLAENLAYTNNNMVGLNYTNSTTDYNTYGRLYSFNEVTNANLAPQGWHIPSSSEILSLAQYIQSNYNNNGGALKSTSSLWVPPNLGATNATGFGALPSGNSYNGNFSDAGGVFYMWTATAQGIGGNAAILSANNTGLGGGYYDGNYYFAVRCVKD